MKLIIFVLFPFLAVGAFEYQEFVQQPDPIRARDASKCTDDKAYCLSCQSLFDCDKEVEVNCSSISTVCGDNGGIAACYSSFDNYDTIPKPTNNECLCRTQTTGGNMLANGVYQDPFNANHYVTCTGGVATFSNCPEGQIYHEVQEACVQGIDCGVEEILVEDPLNCGIYYDCTEGGIQKNCALGQIFDASVPGTPPGDCVNPMSDVCDGHADFDLFQNPHACYIGLRCDGNSQITHCESCQESDIFGSSNACEPGACDPLTPLCMQEYWEKNSECNKCTDADTSYATREDCSEYYFKCQEDGSGGFEPELTKCPDSFPFFNPSGNHCDIACPTP